MGIYNKFCEEIKIHPQRIKYIAEKTSRYVRRIKTSYIKMGARRRYPQTEKRLALARTLNASLDYLLLDVEANGETVV